MQKQNKVIKIPLKREDIDKKFRKEFDWISAQSGIQVEKLIWLSPSRVATKPLSHQPRSVTITQQHKNKFKRYMDESGWDRFPPPVATYDPLTDQYLLITGHHRQLAAVEALLREMPFFIVTANGRTKDGLDSLQEFQQADNARHKPALCHDEDAMVKYLRKLADHGHFDAAKALAGKEKRDKIRELAHPRLKQHYANNYSKPKRRGAITRFLNGEGGALIKSWSAPEAQDWFVKNNHLADLGVYDPKDNRYDMVTQAHIICTWGIGQVASTMRSADATSLTEGAAQPELAQRKQALRIRVGIYDNNARDYTSLAKNRAKCLKEATAMNLDTMWTPFVYDEIYFIYQSLAHPKKEAQQPIVYHWDSKAGCYRRMEHV